MRQDPRQTGRGADFQYTDFTSSAHDLRNWEGALHAGEGLVANLATGGRLTLVAPGETCTIHVTRSMWIAIYNPTDMGVRAALRGHAQHAGQHCSLTVRRRAVVRQAGGS